MVLSFLIQAAAVIAVVIISIFTVDKLGAVSMPHLMPPLPRPKAMTIVATERSTAGQSASIHMERARPVFAPTHVPNSLAKIVDGPEMYAQAPAIGAGSPDGVASGILDPTLRGFGGMQPPPPPPPPPTPPPTETKTIKLGGNVMEAKLVKRVMPVYPALARQMRLSGTVRLEGVISRSGLVINLQVVSGHPMLAAAALEAVRQWVYRPTLLNGEAVEVIAPIDVHFTLSQ